VNAAAAGTVGLLGLGRFGQAFGRLLAASGYRVAGFDPADLSADDVSPITLVDGLAAVCRNARFIVLACPVRHVPKVLRELAPHLDPGRHVVLDVGSVKVTPSRAMEDVLGARVPWVATHPLFGPVSLALGERPLHAVVCPNAQHPRACEEVSALLLDVGCRIHQRTPEDHDREMAQTHALAYLVAKAVLDAGFDLDSEIAPPSARAIARAVEAARADSGHLLTTLHRDNPFAAEIRRRFLDAVAQADRSLSAPAVGEQTGASSREPAGREHEPFLPDLGRRSPQLREVRELIDEVDREIVSLLGRRMLLARRAGLAKSALGHAVRDERREHEVLDRRRAAARELGLPIDLVAQVFETIMALARRVQGDDAPPQTPREH
jgi:prephenate dehydrogenase